MGYESLKIPQLTEQVPALITTNGFLISDRVFRRKDSLLAVRGPVIKRMFASAAVVGSSISNGAIWNLGTNMVETNSTSQPLQLPVFTLKSLGTSLSFIFYPLVVEPCITSPVQPVLLSSSGFLVSIKMILNAALYSGFFCSIYGKRQGQVMCLLFKTGKYTTKPMEMSSRLPNGHQYVSCKIYRGCCVDNLLFVVWF